MFKIQSLADNIKKYRHKNKIKQYELAKMLHVSPQSVSKWEQCLSVPDIENLCRLSEIFKVSIDKLLNHKYAASNMMIAIDGGGTKTEFILFSDQGSIKRRIILDGCNPNICGIERTCEILKTGIESLCTLETNISAIYCGIAGALSGNNREKIKEFLKDTYEDIITECNSDIFNISASVTNGKCITAICGTGSNVCAINGTKINRVGGRLFYLGAGTSGRLGVLDASECPPTFGADPDMVTGIIAGGDGALRKAVENAEDNPEEAIEELKKRNLQKNDVVVGISAAGGAGYVVNAVKYANSLGCATVGVTSNKDSLLDKEAKISICTDTGAEVVTGSTRLKAGTAQKLVLNMLTTVSFIRCGYVYENLMVNLKPTNIKLKNRMIRIVCDILGFDSEKSEKALEDNNWSIPEVLKNCK